jgi:ATP/ADP translocase
MRPLRGLAAWLDVRPNEVRNVTLSFLGAFFAMAFLVLARSLREAFYLAAFRIETLPYITGAVAILSIPTVGAFGRMLTRYSPKKVLIALLFVLAAGLLALAPFGEGGFLSQHRKIGIIAFYLWTALGTLLLTSGFWVVIAEYFPVRGAKRLYGLIGAGGTAGAMVVGTGLVWLAGYLSGEQLALGLIGLLFLFFLTQQPLPRVAAASSAEVKERSSFIENFALAWRSPHLRTVSLIVFVVALATTLLDFQFKELAQATFGTDEALTGFFGAFYGWIGAAALVLQLLVVARFLTIAGLAWSLALLPIVLGLGSVGVLVVPSLVLVTAVRGADATFRKSIYRSALEVTYVPVPSLLRRKTKTFVDSVIDSIGEGLGAGLVFLWITALALPSRLLSLFIVAASLGLIVLSRRMGRQYLSTVAEQLQATGEQADAAAVGARLDSRDLVSGTFTRIDIRSLVDEVPGPAAAEPATEEAVEQEEPDAGDTLARLRSSDPAVVARTLDRTSEWHESHLPILCRLLARDPLVDRAVAALSTTGDPATPYLADLLTDDTTDFVIRRRIPRVLARMGGPQAQDALLDALAANRFEVRYRAAIALVRRRERGLPRSERDEKSIIWTAIRSELGRSRPVWEMQRLLDAEPDDQLVVKRVGVRGELSLEHTFRLLSLVLDPAALRAAFNGVVLSDERLKSFSLEYLEQVLPTDVRKKLWPFIGDVSEYKRAKLLRPLDDVVTDLMNTGETLFADERDRAALKRMLEEQEG